MILLRILYFHIFFQIYRGYQISVVPKANREKRQSSPESHVVAEIPKDEVKMNREFVIGDNKTRGSYHNPPLNEGAMYKIYTGFVSRINETVMLFGR